MFPEDYSIKYARLIRIWIAEGFVKGVKGKTVEQVAEEYLVKLTNRSLVQASRVDFDGRIRFIRVHDLTRELKSWPRMGRTAEGSPNLDRKARRLSIHCCITIVF